MYPKVNPQAVKAEAKVQRKLHLKELRRHRQALYEVGSRILAANSYMCGGNLRRDVGFTVGSSRGLDSKNEYYDAAVEMYDLGRNRCTVIHVVKGGAGWRSGLRSKDVITAVNGELVKDHMRGWYVFDNPAAWVWDELEDALEEDDSVALSVRRGGKNLELTLTPENVCGYELVLSDEPVLNAYATENAIVVTRKMIDFATQDELALIVGHELGHHVMGHLRRRAVNTGIGLGLGTLLSVFTGKDILTDLGGQLGCNAFNHSEEREADYTGMYFAARAGFDVSEAAVIWRKMAAASGSPGPSLTHPAEAERYLALRETEKEIRRKRRLGLPLTPTMRDGGLSKHALADTPASGTPNAPTATAKPVESASSAPAKTIAGAPGTAVPDTAVPPPPKASKATTPKPLPAARNRTLFPAQ